jgi:hypothetical protein
MPNSAEPSLYKRLGGYDAIVAAVDERLARLHLGLERSDNWCARPAHNATVPPSCGRISHGHVASEQIRNPAQVGGVAPTLQGIEEFSVGRHQLAVRKHGQRQIAPIINRAVGIESYL